jgi:hypothetical protein
MILIEIPGVIFCGHSKGEFDGIKYDNVLVSNGLKQIKLKNRLDEKDIQSLNLEPEKTKVDLWVSLDSKKEDPILFVRKIAKSKS